MKTKFNIHKKLKLFLLPFAAVAAVCVSPVNAWNGTGHMAVAGIAYDNLTPKAKASVDALLLRHRDYSLWMSELPAGYTDRPRFAFMKAATWPDDIRKTPDDRPIWHYLDIPIVAPGYAADPIAMLPVTPNAETQIPAETALLGTASATDGDRAIALCWVEHLVGDIHQPLHAASFFSAQFPKGDRGGNSENLSPDQVQSDPIEAAAHPKRLHAFWDDLAGSSIDPMDVQKVVVALETPTYGKKAFPQLLTHTTAHDWALESCSLAKQYVYLNGTLPMTPSADGKADAALPAGYIAQAHVIGYQQIALAGLRLANLLNSETFPPVTAAPTTALPTPAAPLSASLPTAAAGQGPIIGNKRSHIYHLPGSGSLPGAANRVYFQTEAEAQAAGFHKSGS